MHMLLLSQLNTRGTLSYMLVLCRDVTFVTKQKSKSLSPEADHQFLDLYWSRRAFLYGRMINKWLRVTSGSLLAYMPETLPPIPAAQRQSTPSLPQAEIPSPLGFCGHSLCHVDRHLAGLLLRCKMPAQLHRTCPYPESFPTPGFWGAGNSKARGSSPCAASCDEEPTYSKAGLRKAASVFWASPLPAWSPHHWAPTPLPSPDRSSSCPRELRRCPGMGPCTRRQTQAGAHTAPALSRLKPGSGRLISHGLQEHTGLRGTEPRCRGITFSSLRAAAAASSSKRRFAPGW